MSELREVLDQDVVSGSGAVLLVDEDRADLHYFSVIIRGFGYQVRTCKSYEEAVRLLDSDTFGLVIVGQGSPKFEGRSVLARANQIDRALPVLVVARSLDMPCYLEAMQLGAVDYLAEPITMQELARAVETHLRTPRTGKERAPRTGRRERQAGLSA